MAAGIPATATVTVAPATTSGVPATATVTVTTPAPTGTAGSPATATVTVTSGGPTGTNPGTPATASVTVTVGALPTLGYVGDSLTVGGLQNNLLALFNGFGYDGVQASNNGDRAIVNGAKMRMDGKVGRPVQGTNSLTAAGITSQDIITNWRTAGFTPHTWVLALISNDFGESLATLKANINTLLNLVAADPPARVMWVGPVLPASSSVVSQIPTMYQALREVAAARTDVNMTVYDISTAFHNGRDESTLWNFSNDSPSFRHMTPAGYVVRNQLIADAFQATVLPTATVTGTPGTPANAAVTVSAAPASGTGSLYRYKNGQPTHVVLYQYSNGIAVPYTA